MASSYTKMAATAAGLALWIWASRRPAPIS